MAHIFEAAVVEAVLGHMNGDHQDDNLLICRAFAAEPDAITAAEMIGFDGDAGVWRIFRDADEEELPVAWPGGPISERSEVRREVVALYDLACERLGVQPRPHT